MGLLQQADFGVFKQAETWKAFGIAALMFVNHFICSTIYV